MTFDLKEFRIKSLPNTAYYMPNFITEIEEKNLLKLIYSAPKPKWITLSNRRLQNWGGFPHPKGMIQEPLPEFLDTVAEKITKLGVFGEKTPNHVLVNEYHPGQGIMPHEDGPLFYPTITTINLGSHTVLDYYSKMKDIGENKASEDSSSSESSYVGSLLLEPLSLLVVQEDLYTSYLHGIKEVQSDNINEELIANFSFCSVKSNCELLRKTRISLTIRHVPNVLKTKFVFGKGLLRL